MTDYDCWHETEEAVTVEAILATLHQNVAFAKQLLQAVVPAFADPVDLPLSSGLGQRHS